ncbi:unnamed protein product [Urochloa humidicola]
MEVEVGGADVADSGGATATVDGMQMAIVGVPPDSIAIGSDKEAADVVHVVAESILADGVKVAADEGDANSVKVAADATSGDKMHPKVVARLEKLLRRIDPTFRDIFVDMLKLVHLPGQGGNALLRGGGLHLQGHGLHLPGQGLHLLAHLVVLDLDQDEMVVMLKWSAG